MRHAAAIGGDTASLAAAQSQLGRLGGLQHRLEHAPGGSLAAIRAEIVASVAATQSIAQQARTSVANAQAAEVALHAASERAHREVTDIAGDLFERKIFDPYLRFASAADEEAFRAREAARQRYIQEQLGRGTPEGNLNAAAATVSQIEDAGAHGADQSPEFQSRLDRAQRAHSDLARAVRAEGVATDVRTTSDPSAVSQIDEATLASLRVAGVTVADQTIDGHGVAASAIERARAMAKG